MDPTLLPAELEVDALRRHRAELLESIRALENALTAPAVGRIQAWSAQVSEVLGAFAADFQEHIAFTEGPEGIHRDVLAAAPRLTNAVDRLTSEHSLIGGLIDEMIDRMNGPITDDDVETVRVLGTGLIARLIRHRQRSADVLYEAFESDLGGED